MDWPHLDGSRIVQQDIDAAIIINGHVDEPRDLLAIADVARDRQHIRSEPSKILLRRVELVLVSGAEHERGTLFREPSGERQT